MGQNIRKISSGHFPAGIRHIILIIFIGLVIYSNSFRGEFVSDDAHQIWNNAAIRNFRNIEDIWRAFNTRFIAGLSFAINYEISKLETWSYHVFNTIIHIINSILVYFLVRQIFSSPYFRNKAIGFDIRSFAFFSSLIFLCHPVQTQAVAYISQRFMSLASMFYLLTLVFYVQARLSGKLIYRFSAFVFMILGAFTKEMIITVPLMLSLFEIFFLNFTGEKIKDKIKKLAPFFLVFIILPLIFLQDSSQSVWGLKGQIISRTFNWNYFFTEINVLRTYLRLMFLPVNLNHDYSYPIAQGFWNIPTVFSSVLLVSLFASAIFLYKRNRLFSFCVLWFFIATSVEVCVVSFVNKGVIYEHWIYLAMAAFSILIGQVIYQVCKDKKARIAVFLLVLAILSVMTYQRNKVWQTHIGFWQDVLKKSPYSAGAYNNLGSAYFSQNNIQEAKRYLAVSILLDPTDLFAYNNLGLIELAQGSIDEAMKYFYLALEMDAGFGVTYNNLGVALLRKGDADQAKESFLRALELNPLLLEPRYNLIEIYSTQGNIAQAIELSEECLRIDPGNERILYGLITFYFAEHQKDKALQTGKKFLKRGMTLERLTGAAGLFAQNNFTNMAFAFYDRALLADPGNKNVYLELGKLYGNLGEFENAIAIWQEGKRLAPGEPQFDELMSQAEELKGR